MGLADKGLISGSSSEGMDSTPQQGRHGPCRLRQMLQTAARVETLGGEGRDGESKGESERGDWVSEREQC